MNYTYLHTLLIIFIVMNYSIPEFKALCRRSWFTKNDEDHNTFDDVYVFGIQSVTNKIISIMRLIYCL